MVTNPVKIVHLIFMVLSGKSVDSNKSTYRDMTLMQHTFDVVLWLYPCSCAWVIDFPLPLQVCVVNFVSSSFDYIFPCCKQVLANMPPRRVRRKSLYMALWIRMEADKAEVIYLRDKVYRSNGNLVGAKFTKAA